MKEQLISLANRILEELNSGARAPELHYVWNYRNLAFRFNEWCADSGEDFRETLLAYMGEKWPLEKIDAFAARVQSPTMKDLEEFAYNTDIELNSYAYIELHNAGKAVGCAIFGYEHFNETPYEIVEIFSDEHDMNSYIREKLIGNI